LDDRQEGEKGGTMDVIMQAMAVARQAEESAARNQRALDLMEQAVRLCELARMLEAEAMSSLDYEELAETKILWRE
jgi:CO dehydrogenase/acetyl-CoA synthase delta subunit